MRRSRVEEVTFDYNQNAWRVVRKPNLIIIWVSAIVILLASCANNPMSDTEECLRTLEYRIAQLETMVGTSDIPIDDYIADLNERVEQLEQEEDSD